MSSGNARLDFAYDRACELLLSAGVASLPINPLEIIKQKRWGIVTYSELCSLVPGGAMIKDIEQTCRSKDGFTVFSGGNFCIAYNDTIKIKSRIAFTLMHEAGHIMCGHFKGGASMLNGGEYRRLEAEANYFASNVLAPAAVINACGLRTPQLIKAACGISGKAAQTRFCEIASWEPRKIDEEITHAFRSYIRVISRRNLMKSANVDFEE